MSTFTLYVKKKTKQTGSQALADKGILLLQGYINKIIEKSTTFTDGKVVLVDSSNSPALGKTDVIVYFVDNPENGVIKSQGGNVAMAAGTILGLTDLNKKICEIYFDRIYTDSSKEFAGACYHEAAHIKSNQDNTMHTGKDGFLKDSPDYNGSPTTKNDEFVAKHLNRDVTMTSSY